MNLLTVKSIFFLFKKFFFPYVYIGLDLQKDTSQCWDKLLLLSTFRCRTKGFLLAAIIPARIKL